MVSTQDWRARVPYPTPPDYDSMPVYHHAGANWWCIASWTEEVDGRSVPWVRLRRMQDGVEEARPIVGKGLRPLRRVR